MIKYKQLQRAEGYMQLKNCKICNSELSNTGIYTGVCVRHAEKERKMLVKTLVGCTMVGGIMADVFFEGVRILQLRSTGYFYGTDAGFRIYSFFVMMDFYVAAIISAVLFFLPFGIRLDASFSPCATSHTYEGDGFISLLRWIIGTVLAPVFIIVKLIRLRRLRKYIEAEKKAPVE